MTMNRMFGMTLLAVFFLGLNSTGHAQTFPTDYYGEGGYGYGPGELANLPFGGFGFEYTQGPPVSGILMNRFGQVVGTTYVASGPVVETVQPQIVQPAGRPMTRFRIRRVPVQPRYAVTTGSLGWPGANGVFVNSPAMRYRSYGYGYSLSPYGTTLYYGPWKGQTLGY
jgi:hypothetical protein